MTISIRPGLPDDLTRIAQLIRELAEYEKLSHAVRFDEAELGRHLFGPSPKAEVLIGEADAEPQGFALFFPTFSTFEGKAGIWLEDLYVRPHARRKGLGKALLLKVAQIAKERGCARFEWSVLNWNAPSIGFYRGLGAVPLDDWQMMRMDRAALEGLNDR